MKISKADARTWFEFFASLPEYEELSPRQEEIVWAALRQIEEAVEAEQRRLIGEIPGVDSLDGRALDPGPLLAELSAIYASEAANNPNP